MRRDPRVPLADILQAAELIGKFVGARSFAEYAADDLLRSGVERQFEIIGEALNRLHRLDPSMLDGIREHRRIIDFRNVLIHGYSEIDSAVVWSVYVEKLPALVDDVRILVTQLGTS